VGQFKTRVKRFKGPRVHTGEKRVSKKLLSKFTRAKNILYATR
jgi:hypothetical protein